MALTSGCYWVESDGQGNARAALFSLETSGWVWPIALAAPPQQRHPHLPAWGQAQEGALKHLHNRQLVNSASAALALDLLSTYNRQLVETTGSSFDAH